ncbi:RNA polymerase subunit RPABC4/transcription elongation factor Spt4 [Evansella vedderi]|uniref:RNA polymerase subunit RPABC4/transcription elongation factor Spt4 n=1 Tax=Evansella vedderi TaxID=38282 RepID=A0ABT9ZZK4_9BACI|nr:hypothetical protein [Evansella vedderi]MDQ0256678.1 RNA polymerase subunit RPABC4/transcription elongation factor Spt4 [Evansella vedderi]
MDIIPCPKCNKALIKRTREICPKCFQKDNEEYRKVTSIIRGNPSITLSEVSNIANISMSTLLRWKRYGRI